MTALCSSLVHLASSVLRYLHMALLVCIGYRRTWWRVLSSEMVREHISASVSRDHTKIDLLNIYWNTIYCVLFEGFLLQLSTNKASCLTRKNLGALMLLRIHTYVSTYIHIWCSRVVPSDIVSRLPLHTFLSVPWDVTGWQLFPFGQLTSAGNASTLDKKPILVILIPAAWWLWYSWTRCDTTRFCPSWPPNNTN